MPEISVIMPVYNAAPYLKEAIGSILDQTFQDFEFIILNDASTDGSEAVILSFNDPRIRYYRNPVNLGLIKTLNKAIELCTGRFVARMDNDDMADKRRFELQLDYLNKDPDASLVCSPILGITSAGKIRDHWPTDIKVKTPEQIRDTLPWENCIVHPSVMIRRDVITRYKYSLSQKGSEDWDLWLRLVRDGHKIIKTEEVLLRYRIHDYSMTSSHNRVQSPQIKSTLVKLRFAFNSLRAGRLNAFVAKTVGTIYKDLGYDLKTRVLPRRLRQINWAFTISPVTARSQYQALEKLLSKSSSEVFLFFPYSHLGGAEKVHGQITKAVESLDPLVFFTGLHNKDDHRDLFGDKATVQNIAAACYHPLYARKTEKLFNDRINACKQPRVFGCNNDFFYRLILQIPSTVFVADLVHDIQYEDNRFANTHLKNYLRCNRRVFISHKALERTLVFYEQNFVDDEFRDRLIHVNNYSELTVTKIERNWNEPYNLLYVGRDTPEKQVQVLVDLSEKVRDAKLPYRFTFIGPDKNRYQTAVEPVEFKGVITDPVELSRAYAGAHFILISSSSEGFPLSVVEGMQSGCIPLCTAVGDIPYHVKEGETGFLINAEGNLPLHFLEKLQHIQNNRSQLKTISEAARAYASVTFSRKEFEIQYRSLLATI